MSVLAVAKLSIFEIHKFYKNLIEVWKDISSEKAKLLEKVAESFVELNFHERQEVNQLNEISDTPKHTH